MSDPSKTSSTTKPSLLIVDDDRYNRDFYQELLTDNGYAVDTAANGNEGIEKMTASPHYDLIFLDIVMPEKDGMETLTFLQGRQDIRGKHGPIYMLSALGQESVVENATQLGAAGYIVKSDITPDQLLRKIQSILTPSQTS